MTADTKSRPRQPQGAADGGQFASFKADGAAGAVKAALTGGVTSRRVPTQIELQAQLEVLAKLNRRRLLLSVNTHPNLPHGAIQCTMCGQFVSLATMAHDCPYPGLLKQGIHKAQAQKYARAGFTDNAQIKLWKPLISEGVMTIEDAGRWMEAGVSPLDAKRRVAAGETSFAALEAALAGDALESFVADPEAVIATAMAETAMPVLPVTEVWSNEIISRVDSAWGDGAAEALYAAGVSADDADYWLYDTAELSLAQALAAKAEHGSYDVYWCAKTGWSDVGVNDRSEAMEWQDTYDASPESLRPLADAGVDLADARGYAHMFADDAPFFQPANPYSKRLDESILAGNRRELAELHAHMGSGATMQSFHDAISKAGDEARSETRFGRRKAFDGEGNPVDPALAPTNQVRLNHGDLALWRAVAETFAKQGCPDPTTDGEKAYRYLEALEAANTDLKTGMSAATVRRLTPHVAAGIHPRIAAEWARSQYLPHVAACLAAARYLPPQERYEWGGPRNDEVVGPVIAGSPWSDHEPSIGWHRELPATYTPEMLAAIPFEPGLVASQLLAAAAGQDELFG